MGMLRPASAPVELHRPFKRRRLKNVPVLPTLLTLGNLLCGFAAIYFCMRAVYGTAAGIDPAGTRTLHSEHLERLLPSFLAIAAWCIFGGMVFDALDGRIARMSQRASRFGIQLDSLADVITFGVAPAILIIAAITQSRHGWEATPLTPDAIGRGRWLLVAVYVACAAIRLARFNVETGVEESAHRSFKGLPSPAAAGVVASLIVLHERLHFWHVLGGSVPATRINDALVHLMPLVSLLLGLMMVSRMPYSHLIGTYLRGRRPISHLALGVAMFILLVTSPEITLAVGFVTYALTGPIRWGIRMAVGRPSLAGTAGRPENRPAVERPGAERIA